MPVVPITVRCECGEVVSGRIGEPVRCSCGRTHDTDAPPEVRAAIVRARRGMTVAQRCGLLIMPAGGLLGLALTESLWGFLASPVVGVAWYFAVMPLFKRRFARAMQAVRWTTGTS